jgi:hypothetical protein
MILAARKEIKPASLRPFPTNGERALSTKNLILLLAMEVLAPAPPHQHIVRPRGCLQVLSQGKSVESVYLVYLIYLVCLVGLVYLVYLVCYER